MKRWNQEEKYIFKLIKIYCDYKNYGCVYAVERARSIIKKNTNNLSYVITVLEKLTAHIDVTQLHNFIPPYNQTADILKRDTKNYKLMLNESI